MNNILELNKIHLGDCLDLMKDIPDNSIEMILCDLPYGITRNNWDVKIDLNSLWEQYERIIIANGAIVLFGTEPFSTIVRSSNLARYKYDWKWLKSRPTGFQHAKNKPMKKHEDIMIFSKGVVNHKSMSGDRRMVYNPIGVEMDGEKEILASKHGNLLKNYEKQIGNKYMAQKNFPNDLLEFPSISKNERLHPTQKPVELCEYLIETYSNEDGVVLDNCMGSGTTAIAALNAKRNWIGMEMDLEYFNLANNRIEKHKDSLLQIL